MHLRKLTLTVGLFGTLWSTWAFGLGLGEITLKSTLNQPLDAEIRLLQVRNLNEEDILVELASSADFQRFGIERLFFLQNLKFDVQLDHPNGPMVRIRSDEPVREPYLVFLIQAQSPSSGRLLREYTLLLDLPVFTAETPAPVQTPALHAESSIPAEPAIQAPSMPAPAPQIAQREGEPYRAPPAPGRSTTAVTDRAVMDGDVYGPVQANDTLWGIAARIRPSGVSMQQSMLALQRANPDAFINGNINLLKRGQVLRVPDSSEWLALDQQSAIREVASQNRQWTSGSYETASGAELAASASRPSSQRVSTEPRGQLTLSAPGLADQAAENSGAGSAAGRTEALQNELAIASEQLDATQRENRELNSRILELEEQIATMERLLDVSSAELRALQLASEQELSTAGAEQATEEALVEEAAPAAAVRPATNDVSDQAPPPPSLKDQLMGQIWYLLSAALALIAGLAYVLHRRRQQEDEWEAFEDDDLFSADANLPGGDEFMEEGAALDDAVGFSGVDEDSPENDLDADQPVEAETGDVVAEADIYIAYGKLEQAEEMLRRALAGDTGNLDARVKLLEVLVEKNDVAAFDDEYRVLLGFGNGAAGSRAAELRGGFADAPPFVDGLHSIGGQAEEPAASGSNLLDIGDSDPEFGDLDLSFDLDAEDDSGADSSVQQGTGLDFSLDLSDDFQREDPGSEASRFDESAFDFELDDDSAVSETTNAPDLELNLDDEMLELDSAELGGSGQSTGADLSFDLELDSELELTGSGEAAELIFDLELDEDLPTLSSSQVDDELGLLAQEQAENTGVDGALSLDLEEASQTLEPKEAETITADFTLDGLAGVDSAADYRPLNTQAAPAAAAEDDFDIELGDLDLEALDQEMEALVGSVDDDVDMAAPVTLQKEATAEIADLELNPGLKPEGLETIGALGLADNAFSEDQDFDPDDLDDEFDFLAESDEVATKLDLARAYIDMGDQDGAKDILDEVAAEGNDEQKREAEALLEKMV